MQKKGKVRCKEIYQRILLWIVCVTKTAKILRQGLGKDWNEPIDTIVFIIILNNKLIVAWFIQFLKSGKGQYVQRLLLANYA